MRLNVIIIISCLLIGLGSCNSSKSTKTAKADATDVVENTVEKVKETMTEAKTEVVKKEEAVETKVKETASETKEVVQSKMENEKSKSASNAPVKEMNTKIKETASETKETVQSKIENEEDKAATDTPAKEINTDKTKVAATKKMQEQQADLVGKYKWLKRVCCGRMQKTTLPETGEESFMTFTEDGKVLYSGTALKNAENCEYTLDMNLRSFPDRPMLKMGKKIAALTHFYGDTLVIDRGYIDLDKNYWLKVE